MNRYKFIAFEPISENEISNYTFDGVENQEKPLNPNEEFIQLTSKIDFKKLNGKSLEYTSPDFQCLDDESESFETYQLNITESLKKHITTTLNETNALIDILQVTKDNTYMQLKKVVKENHEDNIVSYVAAKKMGLAASAQTLLNSTIRLSKTLSPIRDQSQYHSFYSDLATLRKEWRIKWYQKHLVGDLGLSSCGSLFNENGGFQILEEEDIDVKNEMIIRKKHELDFQNLKIILMNNQEGEPILRININESSGILNDNEFKSFQSLPEAKECKLQIDKLNRAQNLLFLQEIFSTMCWESRTLSCPVVVKENRLIINLKGSENLEIDFLTLPEKHWFGYDSKVTDEVLQIRQRNQQIIYKFNLFSDTMIVLLRDLLREKHRSNFGAHFSLVSPIAGPVQIPMSHRYRGTQFYRSIEYSPSEQSQIVFLLPSLLDAVIFYKARSSLIDLLDSVAVMCKGNIFLRTHIQSAQSMLSCNISVTIGCTTYNSLLHYFTLVLSVSRGSTNLDIISDRIRHSLVYETIDKEVLVSFFQSQIWNFKIDVIYKLATCKHYWNLVDLRLTNCQKTMRHNIDVGLIVLSNNGEWLLSFINEKQSSNYHLIVSYSKVDENKYPVKWNYINMKILQRKLMASDLETVDILFTGLC